MRNWKLLAGLLALAFAVTPAFGQGDSIQQQLQRMQAQIDALQADNAQLRADQDDDVLETQINALTERFAAGTTVKSAANPVTLTGEFRFRNSWSLGDRGEFASLGSFGGSEGTPFGSSTEEHDGTWTDARVRLGFQYDFTRDVTAFAELQAHWAFGDGAPSDQYFGGSSKSFGNNFSFGDTNTDVVLYQAWLEVRNIFNRTELSSRTGRQEVVLGNQYQFGNADWYNGWVFDGTRWDWDSESFRLTAMIFKLASDDGDVNQAPSFIGTHDDDELYALYFTLKTIENHELDLYWIYVDGHGGAPFGSGSSIGSQGNKVGNGNFVFGDDGTTAYYHTIGARIGGVFPSIAAGLDWNVEGAYQFGNQNTSGGGDDDIDGFSVEAEVGLTFNKNSMFRVYARFLYAQGPDDDESGYIPLFGNRHSNGGFRARYGLFDLIPMFNVLTLQAGLHFNPATDWTLGATFLWATTDEDYESLGAGNDDDYGIEIDVWGEYRYSQNLTFGAGVAILFPDDQGEFVWGVDDDTQFFFYLQARLLF